MSNLPEPSYFRTDSGAAIVVQCVGVDPAQRAAELAREHGLGGVEAVAPPVAEEPEAPRMTQRDAFDAIMALGLSVRKVEGEFQVKPKGTRWDDATTYFTDDLDDALGTAREMAARQPVEDLVWRARKAVASAREAGLTVDRGNVVDLIADNMPHLALADCTTLAVHIGELPSWPGHLPQPLAASTPAQPDTTVSGAPVPAAGGNRRGPQHP